MLIEQNVRLHGSRLSMGSHGMSTRRAVRWTSKYHKDPRAMSSLYINTRAQYNSLLFVPQRECLIIIKGCLCSSGLGLGLGCLLLLSLLGIRN